MKNYLVRNSLILSLLFSLPLFGKTIENQACFDNLYPKQISIQYRASIDVMSKHLSGILLMKTLQDSTIGVTFINEMGVTYFEIVFYANSYHFNSIQDKMNKKAVKKTLAKDIGMILMRGIFKSSPDYSEELTNRIMTLKLKSKGYVKYTTDQTCQPPSLIQNFGKRKAVVSIYQFYKAENSMPDSIFVQHHTSPFSISLKQMDVTE
jgi:hypothetical protein